MSPRKIEMKTMATPLEELHRSLEYTYRLWEEEYRCFSRGVGGGTSNMSKADLKFLRSRIERVEKAISAEKLLIDQVRREVSDHEASWS